MKIGFGTDLLGQLQNDHCSEFIIRREAMSAQEIIRSATLVNAEIVRQEGKLGELVPGAHADLLVVDGDPYRDISVFLGDGRNIAGDHAGRTVREERAVSGHWHPRRIPFPQAGGGEQSRRPLPSGMGQP